MKKCIYILFIIVLGLLPSCYNSEGPGYLRSYTVGKLKTLSPELSADKVTLCGEEDNNDYQRYGLYFQIGRLKDISEGENTCVAYGKREIGKNRLNGTYYYRLCAILGSDTVFAPNVETFTVDHLIVMKEAQNIKATSVTLSFTSDVESANAKILLSNDKEFNEYDICKPIANAVEDGRYDYSITVENLTPGVTYYAKASMDMLLGSLESEVISFTTENAVIKSVTFYGNGIDGQIIKDDLMVVIKNQTTNEWSEPYHAVYNEGSRDYDILDFDYVVDTDALYFACAVPSTGTLWDNSGYVVFGQGDYQYGADQKPIFWGMSEFEGSNPYIKMQLIPWTAQVTVEYPVSWGQVDTKQYGLAISDKSQQLPGSSYDIISRKQIQNYASYFGRPSEEAKLNEDGTKYSFMFNIFPTNLSSADCSMMLYLINDKKDVPCPDLNIQMGRQYTICFDEKGLDISEVTVKTWEDNNGGSITITPKF